jgi:hypothetical protein
VLSVILSSCGSVVSAKLWVCAVGQSVRQTVGLISVRLWVCAIGQSVKLWVCSIGLAVGLCYRSVILSSCGSLVSITL